VDCELTADLLSDIPARNYAVDWLLSCGGGLEALRSGACDICLVDYSLGLKTGMDFLTTAQKPRTKTPIIMLTGMEAREVDEKALTLGAADSAVYQAKAKPVAAFQIDKPTSLRILRAGAASARK